MPTCRNAHALLETLMPKIGRRGKDLAVRIPAATVRSLSLRIGDELTVFPGGPGEILIGKTFRIDEPN